MSSFVSLLARIAATAHVSPNSIWIAQDVTGARSNGHSSRSSGSVTCVSASLASLERLSEVTPTTRAPFAGPRGTTPLS